MHRHRTSVMSLRGVAVYRLPVRPRYSGRSHSAGWAKVI